MEYIKELEGIIMEKIRSMNAEDVLAEIFDFNGDFIWMVNTKDGMKYILETKGDEAIVLIELRTPKDIFEVLPAPFKTFEYDSDLDPEEDNERMNNEIKNFIVKLSEA